MVKKSGSTLKEAANSLSGDISECRRKKLPFSRPGRVPLPVSSPDLHVESPPTIVLHQYLALCHHLCFPVLTKVTVIAPPAPVSSHLTPSFLRFRSFISEPLEEKVRGAAPLPELAWANRQEMWDLMVKKETGMYRRLAPDALLARHPALQPRMRAILLDWLIEVCEVYRLHRETFYLAVDFIDRFLSLSPSVPKNRLQLIGVSCLFIGAKIEEIYPPKLQEFAYVTGEFQNL